MSKISVNTDTPILDLKGQPAKRGDDVITLRTCMMEALSIGDDSKDGPEKLRRFRIIQKLQKADGTCELEVKEGSLVMEVAAKFCPPLVYGQIHDAIEGVESDGK